MEQQQRTATPTQMVTYAEYQRNYRRTNPDKALSYRINSAIKLLAQNGYHVTKEGEGTK